MADGILEDDPGKLIAVIGDEDTVTGFLLAGGACVVACLWDVTDRDVDRLTAALLRTAPLGAGAAAALPALRRDCRLPALTGAAVVCYGMPV